jgi:hypothetical protein
MAFEDFAGFWKVTSTSENAECAINSIIAFDKTAERVTVLCAIASFPYGESTGSYKPEPENTIEVKIGEETYVISMKVNDSGTPEIAFGPKGLGPLAGSWTAEDYVPGSAPKPAGE